MTGHRPSNTFQNQISLAYRVERLSPTHEGSIIYKPNNPVRNRSRLLEYELPFAWHETSKHNQTAASLPPASSALSNWRRPTLLRLWRHRRSGSRETGLWRGANIRTDVAEIPRSSVLCSVSTLPLCTLTHLCGNTLEKNRAARTARKTFWSHSTGSMRAAAVSSTNWYWVHVTIK